jgi:hypothetical protein
MKKTTHFPALPAEVTRQNIEYLSTIMDTNTVLQKRYHRGASLLGEVTDLFYFFHGIGPYAAGFVKQTPLRQDHNRRLGQLEQILSRIDLLTEEERPRYESLKSQLYQELRDWEYHDHVTTPELDRYESLRGALDVKELDEKNIHRYLRSQKRHTLAYSAVPLGGGAAALAYYTLNSVPADDGTGLLIGGAGAGLWLLFLLLGKNARVPDSYRLLAERPTAPTTSLTPTAGR